MTKPKSISHNKQTKANFIVKKSGRGESTTPTPSLTYYPAERIDLQTFYKRTMMQTSQSTEQTFIKPKSTVSRNMNRAKSQSCSRYPPEPAKNTTLPKKTFSLLYRKTANSQCVARPKTPQSQSKSQYLTQRRPTTALAQQKNGAQGALSTPKQVLPH